MVDKIFNCSLYITLFYGLVSKKIVGIFRNASKDAVGKTIPSVHQDVTFTTDMCVQTPAVKIVKDRITCVKNYHKNIETELT